MIAHTSIMVTQGTARSIASVRQQLLANLAAYGIVWDAHQGRLIVDDLRATQASLAASTNRGGLKHAALAVPHFARPDQIRIEEIDPELVEVTDADPQLGKLWSYALTTWRVPVSAGYGRRLRFLVRDRQNGKLIGVLGLCDPLIGSRIRDGYLGWTREQKHERLYNCLTAYVLGAVPPYNRVLGAKLVALMAMAPEVQHAFTRKYGQNQTIIAGRHRQPVLAMVDTYGAFQKSAIYTRLLGWSFVGYTAGQSHLHITANGSWELIREVLPREAFARYEFGQGSNWKLRTLKAGLDVLGLPEDLLAIGWKRAYYVSPLIENLRAYMTLSNKHARPIGRSHDELVNYWQTRWVAPRLARLDANLHQGEVALESTS